ncbi:ATP-binding protein [Virgibacillus senegalensis]|uniref:ATP-binding protein n=1 Tax=Virgibacillus senegalensis TaxID=1499679 RepID=UPI00069E2B88|nr:ATP-binding protein [Virgibacillus senegalensis]
MIGLLKKFFVQESHDRKKPSEGDVFPQLSSLDSFAEVQQKTMTGWILYRLATMNGIDTRQRDALFYLSFTENIDRELQDKTSQLFKLARSGANWVRSNAVIEEELKKLSLPEDYKKKIAKILNEVEQHCNPPRLVSSESWEVYRDVIYASTQGKFLLIKKAEVESCKDGELLCEIPVVEKADIPRARHLAEESFLSEGLKKAKIMSYNLIISEAVTNILKHADKGKMFLYKLEDAFHVVIEDSGPGFPLKLLPKTTLMPGFSTKESLGQGFTLMMKMADQILLETSDKGSTLVLKLQRDGVQKNES